ncbi:MAG: Clp protease N-terminal domain-containing protein [Candidatus Dormibacteria bacterium]
MSASIGPLDSDAEAAVKYARRTSEQARLGHIGTEHLLLGLLEVHESSASRALASLGVTLPRVEAELVEQSMTTQRIILSDTMASSLAEAVFSAARRRAQVAGRSEVTTSDLLMALAQESDGVAAKVLAALGVGPDQVATALDTGSA